MCHTLTEVQQCCNRVCITRWLFGKFALQRVPVRGRVLCSCQILPVLSVHVTVHLSLNANDQRPSCVCKTYFNHGAVRIKVVGSESLTISSSVAEKRNDDVVVLNVAVRECERLHH